jgi:nucleosome binding factor SPN SPT16 subunit
MLSTQELTFRASDSSNLSDVFRNFAELRKRVRQREQKAEQEKDLVVQTKLIRIKDQRVPRLQEVRLHLCAHFIVEFVSDM